MKSMLIVLTAAGVLLVSASASAASGEDAFKTGGCATCHDAEKKKAGPSLKELRATHKPDQANIDNYSAKILGGKGHPKRKGSEEDIKAAVKFALGGK